MARLTLGPERRLLPLVLGDYLLGFTDIVRGAFPRSDKSALPDCGILASSASAQADDSAANVQDNKTERGWVQDDSAFYERPCKDCWCNDQAPNGYDTCNDSRPPQCSQGFVIARCHMHKVTGVGCGLKAAGKVR